VRLLAKGELKAKVNVTVAGASKAALEAVEKAGGTVTLLTAAAGAAEEGDSAGPSED
jgi:large subunit ribosomal protein L15